jgi:Immunity protein 50
MALGVEFPADIPGASDLFAWFGYWPRFHDGELSVHLDRSGPSQVRVHTSERTNDVDSRAYYIARKHVVVTFILEDISDSELDEFNHQNVLSDLTLTKDPNGYKLEFGPCFGLNGTITAGSVRIELEPGIPPNSVYSG